MSLLFQPGQLGRLSIPNRVIMAPMTRSRATDDGVVGPLTALYYAQRASAGMIITEGVFPTADGKGYIRTPGIETEAQKAGWREVVETVHAAGGRMVMQLMHCGRISHPSMQPEGDLPLAPSPIKPEGQAWTDAGPQDFVTPREASAADIARILEGYRTATRNALAIGFDGVELHGATGYLPEQFLSSGSNRRTDDYGGSIENRARFLLQALSGMIAEAGPGRVGLKLSPEMNLNDIHDDDPAATYAWLVEHLPGDAMAYLNVTLFGSPAVDYHALLKPRFTGPYLIGGGLTKADAERLLADGNAAATVFGSAFLANPDLPERFRRDAGLNERDPSTAYTPGPKGYVDYPALPAATGI